MSASGWGGSAGRSVEQRWERHGFVAAELEASSDADLSALLAGADELGSGIGGTHTVVVVGGVTVFVKKVPLTDIERQAGNVGSTRNLFGMPSGCQYGVGSPGFGVWREVAANTMATELAIDGGLGCFAAMYHWRVLNEPASDGPLFDEMANIDEFVAYWHGSAGVRRRVEAIGAATAHVALFLEYIPTTLVQWLQGQLDKGDDSTSAAIDLVEQCFIRDVAAMNAAGLFHFDAHFDNMLTDGEQIYLADFGLATSPSFDLSGPERDFLGRNASHDLAHTITRLVDWLVTEFAKTPSRESRDESIEGIASTRRVPVSMNASARRVIERYAPIAAVINDFYARLHGEDRTAQYPTTAILDACDRSGLNTPSIDF